MNLLYFFKNNKQLEEVNRILRSSNSILQGQVQTLQEWNVNLKQNHDKMQELLFKRFGIIRPEQETINSERLEQIQKSSNWRDVRSNLEKMTRTPEDPTLKSQQEYWKNKLNKDQEIKQ